VYSKGEQRKSSRMKVTNCFEALQASGVRSTNDQSAVVEGVLIRMFPALLIDMSSQSCAK
jgi:hypothetical protein